MPDMQEVLADKEGAGNEKKGEAQEDESTFASPKAAQDYRLWLISLPWRICFTLTMPPGKPGASLTMTMKWFAFNSWYIWE
jgi:hypothetical protein